MTSCMLGICCIASEVGLALKIPAGWIQHGKSNVHADPHLDLVYAQYKLNRECHSHLHWIILFFSTTYGKLLYFRVEVY